MERSDGEGDANDNPNGTQHQGSGRPVVNPFTAQRHGDVVPEASTEQSDITGAGSSEADIAGVDSVEAERVESTYGDEVWSDPVGFESSSATQTATATDLAGVAVGADPVVALSDKLEALQRSVDALNSRQNVAPMEPEIVGASKTLRYAQQTADAILDDARNQAAELVADAERQRSDIIRAAREQAEADYGAERDRVRAEAAAWESKRVDLISEIASLSAVIGRYHDGLRSLEDRLDLTAESLGQGSTREPVIDLTDSAMAANGEVPVDGEAATDAGENNVGEPAAEITPPTS